MADFEGGDLPHGSITPYDDNEVAVESTIDDPPKLRLATLDKLGGAVSWNRLRPDGRHVEGVLLQGKESEVQTGAAEMTLHLSDGGEDDASMHAVYTLRHDQVTFHVPVVSPGGAAQSRFFSANGAFVWNYQDDGHQVQYATMGTSDESQWVAVWSNWHGDLVPRPWPVVPMP